MTRYLIDFKDDASDEAIQEYLISYQCTVIGKFDKLNKVYHVESNVEPPSFESIVELVQNDDISVIKLLQYFPVEFTQPQTTTEINVEDEKNWWKVYSSKNIDLGNETATIGIHGLGTNVYVVDSGIDITHPEFADSDISLIYSMIPGNYADNTGHGTAISSLVVGQTCGITNASLRVVKIFDNNQSTKQSDMLYAFDAILQDAELSSNKVSIVNLSWSIPRNNYIEDKIQHLIDAGIGVVASAGNSGIPIDDSTPAAMPAVCTIGSYNADFTPSDFSNYTDPSIISFTKGTVNEGILDAWSPGEKIWVAEIGGGYGYASGTSLSAAIYSASLSYNISQLLLDNGEPFDFLTTQTTVYPQGSDLSTNSDARTIGKETSYITSEKLIHSFSKSGLLDLSNTKYASSNNLICSFGDFANQTNFSKKISATPQSRVIRVGEKWSEAIVSGMLVKGIEFISELPDWIKIQRTHLVANLTSDLADPAGYESFVLEYNIIPRDDSPSIPTSMTIYTVGSEFDHTTLPADDPILELVLQTMFALQRCFFRNMTFSCAGVCSNYGYCLTYGSGGYKVCSCQPL